ncbi:APEX1 family protein [Megaselia abdita]
MSGRAKRERKPVDYNSGNTVPETAKPSRGRAAKKTEEVDEDPKPSASKKREKRASEDEVKTAKTKSKDLKGVEPKSRKKKGDSVENGTENGNVETEAQSKASTSKSRKKTATKDTEIEKEKTKSKDNIKTAEQGAKPRKGSRKRANEDVTTANGVQVEGVLDDEPTTNKKGKRATPDVEVKTKVKSKGEVKEIAAPITEVVEKPKSRARRAVSVESGVYDEDSEANEGPSTSSKISKKRSASVDKPKPARKRTQEIEEEPHSSKQDEPKPKKGRATKKLQPEVEEGEKAESKPKKGRTRAASEAKTNTDQQKNEDEPKPKKGRTSKKAASEEKTTADKERVRKKKLEAALEEDSINKLDVIVEEDEEDLNDGEEYHATKAKDKKPKGQKLNATDTKYEEIDFSFDKEFKLKISSWNVAGLRSWLTKDKLRYITYEKPDILCLQEIKCEIDKLPDESRISGYHPYWLCQKGGYAGVAIYSKIMPINVEYGIGDAEQDEDGRIITAEYEKFYLICTYVPNSGRKLVTLPKRLRWNALFQKYVSKLNAIKPVIIAGDMNVSHQEIDLANPKTNKKSAGFTQEERDGMSEFLSTGFVDTFRHFYKDKTGAYTYWTYMANARAKNVGWRLDYFLVSERIVSKIVDNVIRSQILGSDHAPITLFANL